MSHGNDGTTNEVRERKRRHGSKKLYNLMISSFALSLTSIVSNHPISSWSSTNQKSNDKIEDRRSEHQKRRTRDSIRSPTEFRGFNSGFHRTLFTESGVKGVIYNQERVGEIVSSSVCKSHVRFLTCKGLEKRCRQ